MGMGMIKHYGHTISVSDIWFVAHHLKLADSLSDEIGEFTETGIWTQHTKKFLPCDNVMYLADAFIDDNVFNSVFGSSVVEMARVFASIYIHFLQHPSDYRKVKDRLGV